LDGLRLLAVGAVLAFHFRLPHAGAGFLGVDLFFVLSGFLITSLLLGQVQGGRVHVADFWARRARRLVPALLPVVIVVLVWGAVVVPSVSRDRLRGDIASTLFYYANWHFISVSTYFANDGVVSPLEHMWSLGVEEQFYLVWPLVLAVVAVAVKRPRQRVIAVGVLAGTGVALSAWRLSSLWAGGPNRAYLGTDSRIFEPLAALVGIRLIAVATIAAASLAFSVVVWREWGSA
jgi:peptidoglycan/LPS O-acetylase OafA/YrhL